MRYIGCKQRLLEPIAALVRACAPPGARVLDIFSGTAVVARHLKAHGYRVIANDRMHLAWVRAKAYVEADALAPGAAALLEEIERAPDLEGLITRQYSPAGRSGRMFFRPEHARRLDAALELLAARYAAGAIDESTLCALLAGLLDAADRVANISGTYGAYLKRWQSNTERPLAIAIPEPLPARPPGGCAAVREDALRLVGTIDCDVLYVDPPYNGREYAANYHVLEAIALRPFLAPPALERFEATIYGKTGLFPYRRSDFCSKRRVARAFETLIARCRARHVIVSYNEEGLLSAEQIRHALAAGLGCDPRAVEHHRIALRRFRSDADGKAAQREDARTTRPRRYRRLEGRGRDEVHEWLFYAQRQNERTSARRSFALPLRSTPLP